MWLLRCLLGRQVSEESVQILEGLCLFKVFVSPYFGIFYGELQSLISHFLTPLGVIYNEMKKSFFIVTATRCVLCWAW